MKPYSVEISIVTVVMADDAEHAIDVAQEHARDAFGDVSPRDYEYSAAIEISREQQLRAIRWDGLCLPYGGDGKTPLRDIISARGEE